MNNNRQNNNNRFPYRRPNNNNLPRFNFPDRRPNNNNNQPRVNNNRFPGRRPNNNNNQPINNNYQPMNYNNFPRPNSFANFQLNNQHFPRGQPNNNNVIPPTNRPNNNNNVVPPNGLNNNNVPNNYNNNVVPSTNGPNNNNNVVPPMAPTIRPQKNSFFSTQSSFYQRNSDYLNPPVPVFTYWPSNPQTLYQSTMIPRIPPVMKVDKNPYKVPIRIPENSGIEWGQPETNDHYDLPHSNNVVSPRHSDAASAINESEITFPNPPFRDRQTNWSGSGMRPSDLSVGSGNETAV
eukprot:UN32874